MFFKELKKTYYQPPSQACLMLFIQVFISIKSLAKPVVKNSGLNFSSFLETIGWSCQADIFHALCCSLSLLSETIYHLTINSTFVRS